MVQSITQFGEVKKYGLASFGNRPNRFLLGQPLENLRSSSDLQIR